MTRPLSAISMLLALLFVILLATVDSSLTTSIALDRSIAYTPWLRRVGIFAMADYVILAAAVVVFLHMMIRPKLIVTPYFQILGAVAAYLALGLIYNLSVATAWKPFLYDMKTVLYLSVPYFFMYFNRDNKLIMRILSPRNVLIFVAMSGVIDILFTYIWGMSQYASYLGVPALPEFLPPSIIMAGIFFTTAPLSFAAYVFFFALDLFNALNRLSMGAIYYGIFVSAAFVIALFRTSRKWSTLMGVAAVFLILKVAVPIALIFNPLSIAKFKADGANTRVIQLQNAMANAKMNIPGIIGKGLGTTWFEIIDVPRADIYSVGTSVEDTVEASMASKLKSIFNFGPASYLHKWGLLGILSLIYLVSNFLYIWRHRLNLLLREKAIDKTTYNQRLMLIYICFLLMLDHVFYIGVIHSAMLTSIMAFWAENGVIVLMKGHKFSTASEKEGHLSARETGQLIYNRLFS